MLMLLSQSKVLSIQEDSELPYTHSYTRPSPDVVAVPLVEPVQVLHGGDHVNVSLS